MSQISFVPSQSFCASLTGSCNLQLVDVRSPAEFNSRRVAGSINVPLDSISMEALQQQGVDCSEPVYLICARGQRSQMAAEKLRGTVTQLFCVEQGINSIPAASLVKGERSVIALDRQVRITAGSLVLLGIVLGTVVAPWGYGISAFVGAGLVFSGATNTCAMGTLLSNMPWNK